VPAVATDFFRGGHVFIIGIDPHKGSHTAVAIDGDERLVGELLVRADRRQRERRQFCASTRRFDVRQNRRQIGELAVTSF
jgi:hypothetical protein